QPVLTSHGLWRLVADRTGTVAIAAAGTGRALTVTVRDPGAGFSAPQTLGTSRSFSISAIEADGTVSVRFARRQAVRNGRAAPFVTSPRVARRAPPDLWDA